MYVFYGGGFILFGEGSCKMYILMSRLVYLYFNFV